MPYSIDLEEFSPTLREFASYKSSIQNCSEKTVGEYMTDLRTFFRFIIAKRSNIPLESDDFFEIDLHGVDLELLRSIDTLDIYEFLEYSKNTRSNAFSARARKLSAIKGLYKYYVNKREKLDVNPAINIETPKTAKLLPKVLSLDESIALLDAVKNDTASATRTRDFCIITLFLNCGIRLSELAGISLPDIDPNLKSMRVFGKGSKERVVYLNNACRMALGDYLTERLGVSFKGLETKALFLSGRGRNSPISVKTVQWMVKKYLDTAGLTFKGYSVHKLRHTAATLMYQSGNVDVRTLKDILGHEQLNTTQIYTHVSNKSMEEAMEKNPLSDVKPPDIHSFRPIKHEDSEE